MKQVTKVTQYRTFIVGEINIIIAGHWRFKHIL
jgi:hypothetical protein